MEKRVLQIDDLYSNREIQEILGVGNAGGVRVNLSPDGVPRRLVVMTSRPTARQLAENPYRDRIEGGVLVYTGAGLEGDQTLGGVNRRIPSQMELDFPVYGFEQIAGRRDRNVGERRWRFFGLLEYLRHYPEDQFDARGAARSVWIFEFRVHAAPREVPVEHDGPLARTLLRESRLANFSTPEDVAVAPAESEAGESFDPVEIERIRCGLLLQTPERFERFVGELLRASGYEHVEVTKYSQDGGIDVTARAGAAMWPTAGMRLQVQAKRWLHTVGRKEVAELRGSLEPHARGAVVTTSHFSRAAIAEASSVGKVPIVLVDGYSLSAIVRRIGLTEAWCGEPDKAEAATCPPRRGVGRSTSGNPG